MDSQRQELGDSTGVDGDAGDSLAPGTPLQPDPTIEAYKAGVDRTLLRENLRLSTDERVAKMMGALRLAEAVRASRRVADRS